MAEVKSFFRRQCSVLWLYLRFTTIIQHCSFVSKHASVRLKCAVRVTRRHIRLRILNSTQHILKVFAMFISLLFLSLSSNGTLILILFHFNHGRVSLKSIFIKNCVLSVASSKASSGSKL